MLGDLAATTGLYPRSPASPGALDDIETAANVTPAHYEAVSETISPTASDTDGDLLDNAREDTEGTDATDSDSDDGFLDGEDHTDTLGDGLDDRRRSGIQQLHPQRDRRTRREHNESVTSPAAWPSAGAASTRDNPVDGSENAGS